MFQQKFLWGTAIAIGICIPILPTLAEVKFRLPSDTSPDTVGGATRGAVKFAPPVNDIPDTVSGGTRRRISFSAPGDPKSIITAAGGTRVGFQVLPNPEAVKVLPRLPIALLPSTNIGHTIAAHPTFYIYLPPTASRQVFFSIQTAAGNFQTYLPISGRGGIVSIQMPPEAPDLEVGKVYRWFLAPIAPGGQLRPDNLSLSGWVKRVNVPIMVKETSPIQRATIYAANGIWYDTLHILGTNRLKPDATEFTKEWQALLEQVGLGMLSSEPFVERLN